MPQIASSRWSVVAAYCLLGVVTQVIWLTLAPLTTVAAQGYEVSVTAIGWLSNVMVAGCVLFSIPAGLLLDRCFKRALALGALLIAAAGCVRLGGTAVGRARRQPA
jgi:fucose permease